MSDSYLVRRGGISGGAGGSGTAKLTVEAPANVNVEVVKGEDIFTGITDNDGKAEIYGLSTGVWTVSISDPDGYFATKTQTITVNADYSIAIDFFDATINVTYPVGSVCTCSMGDTVLTAPDTSGSVTFTVPSAGDWVISCTDGTQTATQTITVTTEGETKSATLAYFKATIAVTYPSGSTLTCTLGSEVLTAETTTGSYTFTVNKAGSWVVKSVSGSKSDSETVSITASGQSKSVTLSYELVLISGGSISSTFGYFACTNSSASGTTLTMRAGSGGGTSVAYSSNKINLTNYTTLYLTYSLSGGEWTQLCVSSSTSNAYNNRVSNVSLSQGGGTISINVTSLNSSYNIGFMHGNSTQNDTATVGVTKLWLV